MCHGGEDKRDEEMSQTDEDQQHCTKPKAQKSKRRPAQTSLRLARTDWPVASKHPNLPRNQNSNYQIQNWRMWQIIRRKTINYLRNTSQKQKVSQRKETGLSATIFGWPRYATVADRQASADWLIEQSWETGTWSWHSWTRKAALKLCKAPIQQPTPPRSVRIPMVQESLQEASTVDLNIYDVSRQAHSQTEKHTTFLWHQHQKFYKWQANLSLQGHGQGSRPRLWRHFGWRRPTSYADIPPLWQ